MLVRTVSWFALLLAACHPAFAQTPDAKQQFCTAAFYPAGYPPLERFVPRDAVPAASARIRGVVARAFLWLPGQTLKVCFRSGTQIGRSRIARHASEWMKYANVTFDFGDVDNPQMCQGDNHEAIKIDFQNSGPKVGYWSLLGRLAMRSDHSMNLSFLGGDTPRFASGQAMPEAEARRITLHEFGHALGMYHEHQSPRSGCNAEYHEQAVITFGMLQGWPPAHARQQMMQLDDRPEFNATEVDRRSIMHYALPPWLFKAGERSPCFVQPNFDLSDGDKAFIAAVYPKPSGPQVVASGPSPLGMRGAKSLSPAAYRDGLVGEYKQALEEAGLSASTLDQLVTEFGAVLP